MQIGSMSGFSIVAYSAKKQNFCKPCNCQGILSGKHCKNSKILSARSALYQNFIGFVAHIVVAATRANLVIVRVFQVANIVRIAKLAHYARFILT